MNIPDLILIGKKCSGAQFSLKHRNLVWKYNNTSDMKWPKFLKAKEPGPVEL